MKYLFLLFIILLLESCSVTVYEIDIVYQDGTKETVRMEGYNNPILTKGCISFTVSGDFPIRCGVRLFTYKRFETKNPDIQ